MNGSLHGGKGIWLAIALVKDRKAAPLARHDTYVQRMT